MALRLTVLGWFCLKVPVDVFGTDCRNVRGSTFPMALDVQAWAIHEPRGHEHDIRPGSIHHGHSGSHRWWKFPRIWKFQQAWLSHQRTLKAHRLILDVLRFGCLGLWDCLFCIQFSLMHLQNPLKLNTGRSCSGLQARPLPVLGSGSSWFPRTNVPEPSEVLITSCGKQTIVSQYLWLFHQQLPITGIIRFGYGIIRFGYGIICWPTNHCTWQVLWKEQPPLQHIEVQCQGVPSDAGWNSQSLRVTPCDVSTFSIIRKWPNDGFRWWPP